MRLRFFEHAEQFSTVQFMMKMFQRYELSFAFDSFDGSSCVCCWAIPAHHRHLEVCRTDPHSIGAQVLFVPAISG